jgi:hypothetical protein
MRTIERRGSKRITFYADARLDALDPYSALARVSNLSTSGAFIDAPSVLPPGTFSRLTFRARDREIRVSIEVVRSVPAIGMGVQFVNLGPEDLAVIEALVRAHG